MRVEIKFRDDDARRTHYYLQHYYQSAASFEKLAKQAIYDIAAMQAKKELDEARASASTAERE